MQMEKIFFLSQINVENSCLKIDPRLVDLYQIKQEPLKIGFKITFFWEMSALIQNSKTEFFHSLSNLGLGVVELRYQRAMRLTFFFL